MEISARPMTNNSGNSSPFWIKQRFPFIIGLQIKNKFLNNDNVWGEAVGLDLFVLILDSFHWFRSMYLFISVSYPFNIEKTIRENYRRERKKKTFEKTNSFFFLITRKPKSLNLHFRKKTVNKLY